MVGTGTAGFSGLWKMSDNIFQALEIQAGCGGFLKEIYAEPEKCCLGFH
jgi:hypothetical protein